MRRIERTTQFKRDYKRVRRGRLGHATGHGGRSRDAATDIGPLITAEHREKVHGFVTRAKEAGATISPPAGNHPEHQFLGTYYPPTLITGAKQDSEIVQGEVFGPVLTVIPVRRRTARAPTRQRFPLRPGEQRVDQRRCPRATRQPTNRSRRDLGQRSPTHRQRSPARWRRAVASART